MHPLTVGHPFHWSMYHEVIDKQTPKKNGGCYPGALVASLTETSQVWRTKHGFFCVIVRYGTLKYKPEVVPVSPTPYCSAPHPCPHTTTTQHCS